MFTPRGTRRFKLSQLAAFSHAQDHLRVQTVHGGIGAPPEGPSASMHARQHVTLVLTQSPALMPPAVTIVGVCLALVLFVSEARQCLVTRRVQEVRGAAAAARFLLAFPAVPGACVASPRAGPLWLHPNRPCLLLAACRCGWTRHGARTCT